MHADRSGKKIASSLEDQTGVNVRNYCFRTQYFVMPVANWSSDVEQLGSHRNNRLQMGSNGDNLLHLQSSCNMLVQIDVIYFENAPLQRYEW